MTTFDTIVVTSPNPAAAEAAAQGPLLDVSSSAKVISTCDPQGVRLGSGGGTLAALPRSTTPGSTILMIHAGGQSSRCPTQMTLGKAWTDLPLSSKEETTVLTNPTRQLVTQLELRLKVPEGSLVVAASDVLLEFGSSSTNDVMDLTHAPEETVIGLAMPAPLTTAQNHGVFQVEHEKLGSSSTKCQIQTVQSFHQKPSLATLQQFSDNGKAWIDTGVIVFLPQAVQALQSLVHNHEEFKTNYTAEGLLAASSNHTPPKLELYSHLLQAIRTTSADKVVDEEKRWNDYKNANSKDLPLSLLQIIFQQLSSLQLQVCTIPQGTFLHLGTTRELLNFYTNPQVLPLTNRAHVHLSSKEEEEAVVDDSCVIMNTAITTGSSICIGEKSLVEHCHLRCTNSRITIGANSVVSGLRGHAMTDIDIPSSCIVQLLPLDDDKYVMMYLGLNDDIKDATNNGTCFHQRWNTFLQDTRLPFTDVWSENSSSDARQRTLWNARLHPIIVNKNKTGVMNWEPFQWITNYLHPHKRRRQLQFGLSTNRSFQQWKALPKLSLAEIQQRSTIAATEFAYRRELQESIVFWQQHNLEEYVKILQERRHEEVVIILPPKSSRKRRFDFMLYFQPVLETWQQMMVQALSQPENYDIAARSLMILADACRQSAGEEETTTEKKNDPAIERLIPSILQSNSTKASTMAVQSIQATLQTACSSTATTTTLIQLSNALEGASLALTAICCGTDVTNHHSHSAVLAPPLEEVEDDDTSWIVSTAPARLDFHGGWSDTPPISYEYGGAVANVSIALEDGIKPLSARCRRCTKSGSRIVLTVENRDLKTGSIRSTMSQTLTKTQDLSDYSDPTAPCALLKCALLVLGIVPLSAVQKEKSKSLDQYLTASDGSAFGLELISTSLLPQGSGLGTSSILAGCILSSLGKCCLGMELTPEQLTPLVLQLEQLLSTGGGWQDQVGGLYGGLKFCTAERNAKCPIRVKVQVHSLSPNVVSSLHDRLLLAYSGQPRLAKNILQKVLYNWATRQPRIVQTVQGLVQGANDVIATLTQQEDELDSTRFGALLDEYWNHKKVMAGGDDSGVEPPHIAALLEKVSPLVDGATVCGAGGGGFLVLLLKDGIPKEQLVETCADDDDVEWFSCQVCTEGLTRLVVNDDDEEEFQLQWHSTNYTKQHCETRC